MKPLRHWAAWLAIALPLALYTPAWAQDESPPADSDAPAEAASAEETDAPSAEAPAQEAPAPEPPPEASQLAQRLEETSTELRRLHAAIGDDKATDKIHKAFPSLRERLDDLAEQQDDLFTPATGLKTLHDIDNDWKDASTQLTAWAEALTGVAGNLDQILGSLKGLSEEWSVVKERSQEEDLPEAVVQRVGTAISEISATEEEVRTRRARVLELQNSVSEELVDVGTVLDLIDQARQQQHERLLESEQPPIWEVFTSFSLDTPVWKQIAQSWKDDAKTVAGYARDHWEPFAWQLLLLLGVATLVGSLDRQSRRTSFQDPELAAAARVLRRPFSAAFLIAVLATPWVHPVAPGSLLEFAGILLVPPVFRLLPQEFRERRDGSLACAAALYFFGILAGQVQLSSDIHRIFTLVEAVGGFLILLKFFKPPPDSASGSVWSFLLRVGRRIVMGGLILAAFANLFGNVSLSDLLTGGFLNTAYIAAIIYAAVRVLDGVMIMLPRTGSLGSVELVRRNAQMFARRGIGLVRVAAAFIWFAFVLRFFRIRDEFVGAFTDVMDASWKVGSLELSAGNLIVFVVAVSITVATARSLQFILRHDILPKLDLPRGVPGAISSATQYTVLGLGFLLSLAVAGVDLGSIALVAGGLGVGIGFGLQNIVNNFVSGLILLFERPVRDGDYVEAAATFGEVKRIGFRSSTIRTWQGSEVIVPNADLISSTVINWTLTDNHRCMEIPVRAAYGNDPEKIMQLLIEVAASHENTFKDPPPKVFFMAFGENSLEFSLRFWSRFEVSFGTRSEISVLVDKALREAGLAAPVPHRVIHIQSDSS